MKHNMKRQSSFILVLVLIAGVTWQRCEAKCQMFDDAACSQKISNETTTHANNHFASKSTVNGTSHEEEKIRQNGTSHVTNCKETNSSNTSSTSYRSSTKKTFFTLTVKMADDDIEEKQEEVSSNKKEAEALASEVAPSRDEPLLPADRSSPIREFPPPVTKSSPAPSTSPPVFFSVCGYHQPRNDRGSSQSNSSYYGNAGNSPCVTKKIEPIAVPSPPPQEPVKPAPSATVTPPQQDDVVTPSKEPVNPTPVQTEPAPSVVVIPPPAAVVTPPASPPAAQVETPTNTAPPAPSATLSQSTSDVDLVSPPIVVPKLVPRQNVSEQVKIKVRAAITSGNVTELSLAVIESEDIYGLTMGFIVPKEDRKVLLKKTPQRVHDGDVVAIKGLLSAALDPKIKGKVVQLLVLAVTSPEGYHFTQFRPLIEMLTKIVGDDDLLHEVIESNPQTYARRMLLCANCSPVHSFVCAHCWPQKVCKSYFWCAGSQSLTTITKPEQKKKTGDAASEGSSKTGTESTKKVHEEEKKAGEKKSAPEAEASLEAQKPESKETDKGITEKENSSSPSGQTPVDDAASKVKYKTKSYKPRSGGSKSKAVNNKAVKS